jgi:predicted house-cleaning noncanonical NTP pyrophosphatase (MazG superfamily)
MLGGAAAVAAGGNGQDEVLADKFTEFLQKSCNHEQAATVEDRRDHDPASALRPVVPDPGIPWQDATSPQRTMSASACYPTWEGPGSLRSLRRVLVAGTLGTQTRRRSPLSQGKLVRDKIPQIIRSRGQEPIVYVAEADEYGTRLRDKLAEEVDEFLSSDNDPEELADILEVLYALAEQTGTDRQQLEKLRAAKAEERGGFAARIIWSGNRPANVTSRT